VSAAASREQAAKEAAMKKEQEGAAREQELREMLKAQGERWGGAG